MDKDYNKELGEDGETRDEDWERIPEDIYLKDDGTKPKESKKNTGGKSYLVLALVSAIVGGIISSYLAPFLHGNLLPYPGGKKGYEDPESSIVIESSEEDVEIAVAKKAMSSVVGITTVETQQLKFYDFVFDERDVEGIGSGVIVDSGGYILTNSHVVANGNAKELKVLFANGEKAEGEVLWSDPSLDLAVVKVNVANLPVADLGDSDELQVGEKAIAIGNPLGLEFQRTMTSGIVSGLNRTVRVDERTMMEDLIQTDASINPGNSGGPLLNKKGEVIGINTAKIGSAEGLGFSIPINKAKAIIEDVIDKGTYERVGLGIVPYDILEYQARIGINLGIDEGVIILEIEEGTPAEKAGLELLDIIVAIDGKNVATIDDLKKEFYNYKKGDSAVFTILRDKQEIEVEVELTELK